LLNFIGKRLVVAMFQLVGLALVVFFAIRMLPADPVARLVGMNSTREAYLSSQQALGLDKSILEQLSSYIVGVAKGDFGHHGPIRFHQLSINRSFGAGGVGDVERAFGGESAIDVLQDRDVDRFALVGLSKPRENRTFAGLPLDAALHERNIAARCSLYVVDTRTGDIAHSVGIEGVVTELYDVTVIPDAKQPSMIGLNSEEQKRTISIA